MARLGRSLLAGLGTWLLA
jgi:hypothetical protein